jgi:hypothetical protein
VFQGHCPRGQIWRAAFTLRTCTDNNVWFLHIVYPDHSVIGHFLSLSVILIIQNT